MAMSATELYRKTLDLISRTLDNPQTSPAQKYGEILQSFLGTRMDFLRDSILRSVEPVVQTGPFAGMRFHAEQAEGCYVPKLLGCYEAELHPVIAGLVGKPYRRIINVGCSEGYYAVGLARLFPEAQVLACDINETGQEFCRELARMNGVAQRVRVSGRLEPKDWRHLIDGKALIFCDIEGDEYELMDPDRTGPWLKTADIIMELHHHVIGVPQERTDALLEAYWESHTLQLISHAGRDPNAFPLLQGISNFDQYLCLCEFRPAPSPWAVLIANSD